MKSYKYPMNHIGFLGLYIPGIYRLINYIIPRSYNFLEYYTIHRILYGSQYTIWFTWYIDS